MFEEMTEIVGLEDISPGAFSASWGDYDSDGYMDLFVTNSAGPNHLFRNVESEPDINHGVRRRMFLDVASNLSVAGNSPSFACSFADYDNDGDLDIYIANRTEDEEDDEIDKKMGNRLFKSTARRLIEGDGTGGAPDNSDELMSWPEDNVNNAMKLTLIGGDDTYDGNKRAVGAFIIIGFV